MLVTLHKSFTRLAPITLTSLYNTFVKEVNTLTGSGGVNNLVFTILGEAINDCAYTYLPSLKWHVAKKQLEASPAIRVVLPKAFEHTGVTHRKTFVVAVSKPFKMSRMNNPYQSKDDLSITLFLVEMMDAQVEKLRCAVDHATLAYTHKFDLPHESPVAFLPNEECLHTYKDLVDSTVHYTSTGFAFTNDVEDSICGLSFNFLPQPSRRYNGYVYEEFIKPTHSTTIKPEDTFVRLFTTFNKTNIKKVGRSACNGEDLYTIIRNEYLRDNCERESVKNFPITISKLREMCASRYNFGKTKEILEKMADISSTLCWNVQPNNNWETNMGNVAKDILEELHSQKLIEPHLNVYVFNKKVSDLHNNVSVGGTNTDKEQQLNDLLTKMINGYLNGTLNIWEVEDIQRKHAALR